MIPSPSDIDQALAVLDWLTLEQVLELRFHISKTIRAAHERRAAGGAITTTAPDWPPIEAALLYVLWVTSDEYLGQQMQPATH